LSQVCVQASYKLTNLSEVKSPFGEGVVGGWVVQANQMSRHLINDAHEWDGFGRISGERRPCWVWLYSYFV